MPQLDLDGPAGRLEALLEEPADPPRLAALVCHPHPQMGGTMHTHAVYRLARAIRAAGGVTLRFNYRGVGRSAGRYDHGRGEADDTRTRQQQATDPVQDNVPASYAIYMVDPAKQTFLIVAAPPAGFMYTDPVAIQPRPEPNATQPTVVDPVLKAQNMALIEVRSVYDTDGLDRMGESMLAPVDLQSGCTAGIAKTASVDAADTRAQVPDLVRIKNPADTAYRCAPAFFVRAFRAVAPQANTLGMRQAIGETEFEPQQILGYAPVEPDGSFKLVVPADVPLGLAILDSKGRAIQTHLNWIQVRPGERRTCDGCHSPRRGASLNSGAIVNVVTKGGTQQYHGTAYWYKRHEMFNANSFSNNKNSVRKSRYRYNTVGYNLGGPISFGKKFNPNKDKLFFFFSQEHQPNTRQGSLRTLNMPTTLERAGDFSNTL